MLFGVYPENTVGACKMGYEFRGILQSYTPKADTTNAVAMSSKVSGSGLVMRSDILQSRNLVSTAGSTVIAASISKDFGGSTAICYPILRFQQLVAGSGNVSASFQDSANDSTWATLQVLGPTAVANGSGSVIVIGTATSAARYRRIAASAMGATCAISFRFYGFCAS